MPASSRSRCSLNAPYMSCPLIGSKLLSVPVEDDLAGLALQHRLEALFELLIREAMGDDRFEIEARLNQRRHLVPGLENLTAINAFDGEHVEHDFIPVERH